MFFTSFLLTIKCGSYILEVKIPLHPKFLFHHEFLHFTIRRSIHKSNQGVQGNFPWPYFERGVLGETEGECLEPYEQLKLITVKVISSLFWSEKQLSFPLLGPVGSKVCLQSEQIWRGKAVKIEGHN